MRYWVKSGEKVIGPYSPEDLKTSAILSPDTLVAPEGATSPAAWRPANSYEELRGILAKPPSPPAPSLHEAQGMNRCSQCGAQNDADADCCDQCGNAVEKHINTPTGTSEEIRAGQPHHQGENFMALPFVSWQVNEKAVDGVYVKIIGQSSGIISGILAKMGIDSITSFTVTEDKVHIESGTWKGKNKVIVPLRSVTRCCWGHKKPWEITLLVGLLFAARIYSSCDSITSFFTTLFMLPIWALIIVGVLLYYYGSSSRRVGDFHLISDRIKHAREDLEAQMLFVA